MASLLIQGGRVLSPADSIDRPLDVLVEDGTVRALAPHLEPGQVAVVLDARGQVVAPGFVDLHVHLREPGGEASETLETGLAAAVVGGFTAVCAMPNTRPVNDRPELSRRLIEGAQALGLARVFPVAAVSWANEGERLTDFAALIDAGAVAFSDDGRPVRTEALLREALVAAGELNAPVIDHCEDLSLSQGGVMNEGPVATSLGLRGIPNASEDASVARDLAAAAATGGRLHVAHISSARSVEMVREAKRRGVRVTCEATPHHIALTHEAVRQYGSNAKMNPPLRGARDVEAILAGLADGTIDAIATDHAPHAPELKCQPLGVAPFGVIGLETALGLALTRLVHTGRLSLGQLVSVMSAHPAHIIQRPGGLELGTVRVGGPADLTVFDPQLEWTYRTCEGRSKSRNSPFDGWTFKGAVTATLVGGTLVYRREAKG